MKILYVEDEKYLAEAVIHLLRKSDIVVDYTDNGAQGLDLALHREYDCIVLDIMLPEVSGWEILAAIRDHHINTPVIMLSALAEVDDKIKALNSGADDYLAKPFKVAELIARLQALTRRPPVLSQETLAFGDLTYNYRTCTLNQLELTAKEAKLLELFLKQPQQVLPKERLLSHAWGDDELQLDNYVEVYISRLRQKFKKLNSKVRIVAVRNLGYKIIEEE